MRLLHWLVEAPLPHVVGAAGGLVTAMVGGGLCIRQGQLATHQVCVAATEQLKGSERVQQALCSERVARTGFVGGYVDSKADTAVLTLTLSAPSGFPRFFFLCLLLPLPFAPFAFCSLCLLLPSSFIPTPRDAL